MQFPCKCFNIFDVKFCFERMEINNYYFNCNFIINNYLISPECFPHYFEHFRRIFAILSDYETLGYFWGLFRKNEGFGTFDIMCGLKATFQDHKIFLCLAVKFFPVREENFCYLDIIKNVNHVTSGQWDLVTVNFGPQMRTGDIESVLFKYFTFSDQSHVRVEF